MSKNFLDFRFFGLLSLMFVTGCTLSSLAAVNDTTPDTQDTITPDVSQPSTDSRFDLSTDEGVFRSRVAGRTITIVDSAGKQSSITFSDDGLDILSNSRTLTINNAGSEALETVRSVGVRNFLSLGSLSRNSHPITASSGVYEHVNGDHTGPIVVTYNYERTFTLNLGSRSGTIKTSVKEADLSSSFDPSTAGPDEENTINKITEYTAIFEID